MTNNPIISGSDKKSRFHIELKDRCPPPLGLVGSVLNHTAPHGEAWCIRFFLHALGTAVGYFGALPCPIDLVTRFGQLCKSLGSGLVQVNVCTECIHVVDQKIFTRDNVNIPNPYLIFTKTLLWLVVGVWHVVRSVVTEREAITFEIAKIVAGSLSSAVQQKLVGESKVIAARAQADAAPLMRQAADVLPSPAAMQIRQLGALQQMARSASSNVVCVPMQLGGDVAGQPTGNSGAALRDKDWECINAVGRAGLLSSVEYVE
ncbi:hypothetical protein EDC04DRAFT_2867212 [Pisolithus marmoratus]|nr:hypothetical protein EDC04DRAFT_2867212 [Pisolithus marmoratus]